MSYGTIKVDTITFTDGGVDKSVSVSGLTQNPTITGNLTVTGTISGDLIQGQTVSGTTITGGDGQFTTITGTTVNTETVNAVSGVFSTSVSGATVQGTAGDFATITGGVTTITSGVFALGTNALPSISFSSDPDTGIYSPGADQVAISTSGSRRLSIDSDGNICAGGANPVSALDLRNDLPIFTTIRDTGSITSDMLLGAFNAYSRDLTPNSIGGVGGVRVYAEATYNTQTTPSYLSFWTHSAIANDGTVLGAAQERLRITSDGKLGLGTSNPNYKLEVAPDTNRSFGFDTDGTFSLILRNTSTNAGADLGFDTKDSILFRSDGDTKVAILNSGNVGIGTSSPSTLLTLSEDQGTTITLRRNNSAAVLDDLIGKIDFFNNDGSSPGARVTATVGAYAQSTAGGTYLAFSTATNGGSNEERLRINQAGNVGIGTTSPSGILSVNEASTSAGDSYEILRLDTAAGGTFQIGVDDKTAANPRWRINTGTNEELIYAQGGVNERLRIDSSGRLLVGTTSSVSSAANAAVEVIGAGSQGGELALGRNDTSIVADNSIGIISFWGNDSDSLYDECASITAFADGTHGNDSKPTRIEFSTTSDSASSPTERLRITSDAYVRLASGTGGIQFNGDTAAANALDDYEEGTFTLTVADAATGGNTGTSSTCLYTKIGRVVTVRGSLFTIDTTGLTAGNTVYFQGLPFAPATHNAVGSIVLENITFSGFVNAQCSATATAFRLAQSSSGSGEAYLNVSALAAGADIVGFEITYTV